MSNKKTEKKRVSSKILVALAALTLVSCCFLGSTFARYTTGPVTGSAGADIADWEIVVDDGSDTTGAGTFEFAVLSPDKDEYNSENRTNSLAADTTSVTITNRGQVDAAVTIETLGNAVTYWVKDYTVVNGKVQIDETTGKYAYTERELEIGGVYHDQQGEVYTWTENGPQYTTTDVNNVETTSIPACWTGVKGASDTTVLDAIFDVGELGVTNNGVAVEDYDTNPITLGYGGSVVITVASATWTSDLDSDDTSGSGGTNNKGTYGDARDTWIGQNISKVGYTFTWSAEQASQTP